MMRSSTAHASPLDAVLPCDLPPGLCGRWLIVFRSGWLVLAAELLFNFLASISAYSTILRAICTATVAQCAD
jgi:hypothetical protein